MSKYIENDITIAILYDAGEIGRQWKTFVEEMFTVELPEQYRDLGLDVITVAVDNMDSDDISNINSCAWVLLLFSAELMELLSDHQAPLYQSNILSTRCDHKIILILGEENDHQFIKDVKRSLSIYPEFPSFHFVRATDKILSDIIGIVSPVSVIFHPDILSCEDTELHITLIANKAYPTNKNAKFVVEFSGKQEVKEFEATLFNPCTLVFNNPGISPGVTEANLFMVDTDNEGGTTKTKIGETMSVWFQSDLDKIKASLEKASNPFSFLCQALNINANEKDACTAVDRSLTESFRKHVPESKLAQVFGNDQSSNYSDGNRTEYCPTLLHFAASHGLRDLTALLLRCPGSVRAFGTPNCEGDFPTNLAEKSGFWDLKDYMICFMEVSAMVDYEMGDPGRTSEMMAQMVTGQYLSLPRTEQSESCYDFLPSMNPPPGYLPMRPALIPDDEEGVEYNQPFIVPIPAIEDSPTYDSMLVRMLESHEVEEDTYMSIMTQHELAPSVDSDDGDAPPIPPRDAGRNSLDAGRSSLDGGRGGSDCKRASVDVGRIKLDADQNESGRKGAERVSYEALSIPKIHPLLSPAQQELIQLQQKVKNNELTTNQAVLRFKEWERKHKEQGASFQFQQECLQRVRLSLIRSREEKRTRGESDAIEISGPTLLGSSTYDIVLRKTNLGDPSEVIYGSTDGRKETTEAKPPEPAPRKKQPIRNPETIFHRESFNSMQTHGFGHRMSQVSGRNDLPPAPAESTYRVVHKPSYYRPPIPPRDVTSSSNLHIGGDVPFVLPRPRQ